MLGTLALSRAAAMRHDVEQFVLISTDKAVNPTNVMGATQAARGDDVPGARSRRHDAEFVTVRFGNVLGSAAA